MTTALMMEAVSTSETFNNFYETARRNIPDASQFNVCNSSEFHVFKVAFFFSLECFYDRNLQNAQGGKLPAK
jgi:hypothetical protein